MNTTELLAGAKLARDFGHTDEHDMLRQQARRFVQERFDAAALRAFHDGTAAWPVEIHRQLAELGWTGLVVAESDGGAGLGTLHLVIVLEEIGRGLLPVPFASGVLASEAIARLLRNSALSAHLSGERRVALALTEAHGRFEPDAIVARAEKTTNGYRLSGRFTQVPFGADAHALIAPFRLPGHALAFFEIDMSGVVCAPDEVVDPTAPTATITVDGLSVPAEALCAPNGRDTYQSLLTFAQLLIAAETLGAAEHALGLTRSYAIERKQFGRPIGSFQAVSHPIVNVMIAVENARSLVTYAAATLDASSAHAAIACRMAKVAACDALWRASDRGVQIHGGFGFTWDCDMHFYFRRAVYARGAFGDPETLRQQLGQQLAEALLA